MGLLSFFKKKEYTLAELASGLVAIPAPVVLEKRPKAEAPKDLYVIDEQQKVFGFHTASAVTQAEGSVEHLTEFDVQLLKERDYWGQKKVLHTQNAACKAYWHTGKSEKEAATLLKRSDSWVKKRFGTFSVALSTELDTIFTVQNGAK